MRMGCVWAGILALPVLQLSGDMFGDAATQQPHEEEDGHRQCDH